MVFQDYALFPHLTIQQNVAFGLKNNPRRRFAPQQIEALTREAIDRVGLTSLDARYPHELSGGQQQRVALARALAPQPAMILLDEPLSNLDVQVRLRLRQEIRSVLKAANTSAIFVTHDQEEALSICDRIAVMNAGQIEQLGTPEELYYSPQSRFVAEFVTQANFIPAQWQENAWHTEIGQFDQIQKFDDRTDLMIRPEALKLTIDPSSKVVICDRQFLGRDYRYELVLPSGQTLVALRPIQERFEVGDRVTCKI